VASINWRVSSLWQISVRTVANLPTVCPNPATRRLSASDGARRARLHQPTGQNAVHSDFIDHCSNPNTTTLFGVPTYTLPLAMVRRDELVIQEEISFARCLIAVVQLVAQVARVVRVQHSVAAGISTVHTIPSAVAFAEILSDVPG